MSRTTGSDEGLDEGAVRILAAGEEVVVPDHDYRVVGISWLDVDADELTALAAAHGAVVFEVHQFDTWEPGVLLAVDVALSVLDRPGADRAAVATSARGGRFAALIGSSLCRDVSAWEAAPPLDPPGRLRMQRGSGPRLWESESWRLVPHPLLVRDPLRDWAWPWARGWGPLTLTIHVAASAGEIERFVAARAPMPYTLEREHRYRGSDHARGPLLLVSDGALQLVRSYPEPADELIAFDAGLLGDLAGGAAGELQWDLVDEGYLEFIATGEDAASLADYLSPASDPAALRARYAATFAPREVDATPAATRDEVLELVSLALGAPGPLRGASFEEWYRSRTSSELPRSLSLVVAASLADKAATEWLLERLGRPRMRLSLGSR